VALVGGKASIVEAGTLGVLVTEGTPSVFVAISGKLEVLESKVGSEFAGM